MGRSDRAPRPWRDDHRQEAASVTGKLPVDSHPPASAGARKPGQSRFDFSRIRGQVEGIDAAPGWFRRAIIIS